MVVQNMHEVKQRGPPHIAVVSCELYSTRQWSQNIRKKTSTVSEWVDTVDYALGFDQNLFWLFLDSAI